jgi:hypothetical protein
VTISSRISKFTRTSCWPSIFRTPLGSSSTTVAAMRSVSFSFRETDPWPLKVEDEFMSKASPMLAPRAGFRSAAAECPEVGHAAALLAAAAAPGGVRDRGAVVDLDHHGQDVPALRRAPVAEQRLRPPVQSDDPSDTVAGGTSSGRRRNTSRSAGRSLQPRKLGRAPTCSSLPQPASASAKIMQDRIIILFIPSDVDCSVRADPARHRVARAEVQDPDRSPADPRANARPSVEIASPPET